MHRHRLTPNFSRPTRRRITKPNPDDNVPAITRSLIDSTHGQDRSHRERHRPRCTGKASLGRRHQFPANPGQKAQEYSASIRGTIFLRFAEVRFTLQRVRLEKAGAFSRRGSRVDELAAYQAEGMLFLAPHARLDLLLHLPKEQNIGTKVTEAMRAIENDNPKLAGVRPKTYNLFTSTLLKELLKATFENPASVDYVAFGRIYKYFLGEFVRTEGQNGGEFYTQSCIVRLLTEVIEPYHGRILDPACGSGGMFASSVRYVLEQNKTLRNSPSGVSTRLKTPPI